MKIVYCISGMYKSGGIERVLAGKANYFVAAGWSVTIITTDQADRPDFFAIDPRVRRIDLGLNYDQLDELPSWKRYVQTWRMRSRHKQLLEEALRREQADIVVSVLRQESSFLPDLQDGSKKVLELHTAKDTPILMHPEGRRLHRFVGKLRVRQLERLAARYDRFVILTEEERPLWPARIQLEVIPNAIPFPTVAPTTCLSPKLIAVGRLEYQKNFPELLRLWAQLAPRYPDWSLSIYGSGWMKSQLQAQIDQLGLQRQVTLEGAVSDMESAYRSASVYVMTSHYEGLPMVLLEASAMGLPTVAYACPSGPRDIITDAVDGYLVAPGDGASFCARLETLLADEALRQRMGAAARTASARFAPALIMQRWTELFTQLAELPSPTH